MPRFVTWAAYKALVGPSRHAFSPHAFLTMPKVQTSRRNRKQSSTDERRSRAKRIESCRLEMVAKCSRCQEKGLRCFVDTASGQCAGCIAVKAECSLFVSDEEWEKVQQEKRRKRLEIARLKAQLAQSEVELLEAEAQEQSFARRDLAVLKELDLAREQAEGDSAPGTDLSVVEPSLPGPSADLGWLQADLDFFDPSSFDYSSFLAEPFPVPSGISGGTPVPVTCSSSGFLQVPKCCGSRAIPST